MKKTNQKGQAIIELLISLPLITACLILSVLFFYMHIQHIWMDHHLYQALICMAQGAPENSCKKIIKPLFGLSSLKKVQLTKKHFQWKGEIKWETAGKYFHIKRRLNLPGGDLL